MPDFVAISITAEGGTLTEYITAHESALAGFIAGALNCVVEVTRSSTAERVVTETGPVFRGAREYSITTG